MPPLQLALMDLLPHAGESSESSEDEPTQADGGAKAQLRKGDAIVDAAAEYCRKNEQVQSDFA